MGNRYTRTLEERFWPKVDKRGENECWPWTANPNPQNYGSIRVGDKMKLAHRTAWELTNGEIPDGLFCCHHCDTPGCCNPNHLFLGTPQDNMTDMVKKGRESKVSRNQGESQHLSKLTKDDVNEIREHYDYGEFTQQEIADYYGVTQSNISMIVHYNWWRHI